MTAQPKIQRLTAFVDWNSQVRQSKLPADVGVVDAARRVFSITAARVAGLLAKEHPGLRFRVDLRLYHGWHKGFQPTANRQAITQVVSETDFSALSPKPSVVFTETVRYGDELLSALPERQHVRLQIHLPNTLREQGARKVQEKMVDTALASDVVTSAFTDPDNWILVLAEDDDLVPPVFVAEATVRARGGRVILMSSRDRPRNFLKLDGLLVTL